MSDLTTIAVILVFLIAGHLSIYFSWARALDWRERVVTRFVQDAPEPVDLRTTRLFITWFPLGMFTGSFALLCGVGLGLFAANIGNGEIRTFGYVCAVQAGFASAFMLCLTIVDVLSLRSRLLQAE